jgi:hypothetical protein
MSEMSADISTGRNTAQAVDVSASFTRETENGAPNPSARGQSEHRLRALLSRRCLFWIVLVVGALVYTQTEFWKQASAGDRANWDYFAQVISRGGVPYRDVVNIKSPLSAYIGAAAILVGEPFGIRDVVAIRIVFVFLAALTVAYTFQVALDYLGSSRVAVLASLIILSISAISR